jgi:regulator of sigma E protease
MDLIYIGFWLVGTLVVVLAPIILIHELGHFIFAKLAGVRVEEFGFGYPPRLLKLWRSQGYLDIGVMRVVIPAGFRLPQELSAGTYVDAVARRQDDGTFALHNITVLRPTIEYPESEPEVIDEETGDVRLHGQLTTLEPGTLYSLNWLPMGAFVRMTGEEDPSDPRSLAAQPKRWRVAVMAAGPVLNIIAAMVLLIGAYTTGIPDKWQVEITNIEPESAAAEAGLQPRDIVVAVDGEQIEDGLEHLRRIIRAVPEQTVGITILREGEKLTLPATPRRAEEGYGLLGILMAPWPDQSAVQYYSLPEAMKAGITDLYTAVVATIQVPARLAQGDITPQEARPASMVGISEVLAFTLQQSIDWGLAFPVLQTASFISLALGLTNLLPLPALDGGRIVFVLIEALRGRRISPEREAIFHFVGLVIMVSLMAFVMLQDVINPIIPWALLR